MLLLCSGGSESNCNVQGIDNLTITFTSGKNIIFNIILITLFEEQVLESLAVEVTGTMKRLPARVTPQRAARGKYYTKCRNNVCRMFLSRKQQLCSVYCGYVNLT